MTQDDIIRMAREAGWQYADGDDGYNPLWKFAALVAAAEREECATICGAISSAAEINEMSCDEDKIEFYSSRHLAADDCADLIRARGKA
jgi:methionine synthase II (cobalamin-independent)